MDKVGASEGLFALVKAELPFKRREPLLVQRLLPSFGLEKHAGNRSLRTMKKPLISEAMTPRLIRKVLPKPSFINSLETQSWSLRPVSTRTSRSLAKFGANRLLTRGKSSGGMRLKGLEQVKSPWEVLTVLNSYRKCSPRAPT